MSEKKNITSTYLKVGDKVQIKVGKNKGVIGCILALNKKKNLAQIEIFTHNNQISKEENQKEKNENSQKNSCSFFIHISNLMLWDTQTKKSSRVGYHVVDHKKVRYLKKSKIII